MKRPIISLSADVCLTDDYSASRADLLIRADAVGVDLLLIGDHRPSLDSLIVAGWLAPRIKHAGLIATLQALYVQPFHVARALSALDFLTHGRSGWLPSTQGHAEQAERFSSTLRVAAADVVAKSADCVAATRALWDSWDSDAVLIDKSGGQYLRSNSVRRVNYRGAYFSVKGPLCAARPPQGNPLLVQRSSDALSSSIAADVDVLLLSGTPLSNVRTASIVTPRTRVLAVVPVTDPASDSEIARWLAAPGIDGVHVVAQNAAAFARFVVTTLPALVRRVGGSPANGETLRERFGLLTPNNPFQRNPTHGATTA